MPKKPKLKPTALAAMLSDRWNELIDRVVIVEGESEASAIQSMWSKFKGKDGKETVQIYVKSGLSADLRASLIDRELNHLLVVDDDQLATTNYDRLIENLISKKRKVEVTLSSVIIPDQKLTAGVLVKSTSLVWAAVVDELEADWKKAYEIPPHVWEEIVAGAYKNAGFDNVILTSRSGDHGRDVIAVKKGIGSIKVIGSVKAYKPGLLVGYDDIRALLGVMTGERDTSKGIITTTSDFPPKVANDPFIAPFLPTRLELMNGALLRKWLLDLRKRK